MDMHYSVKYSRAVSPAAATTDNTAWTSQILDTANFQHNELVLMIGALADADATFTALLEEGDESDLSDASAVADADMLGTETLAGFQFDDDNETRKLGYIGTKRYIRATITPANNTGNAFLAAVWAQSGARKSPQS
jgi:hypothetical protein